MTAILRKLPFDERESEVSVGLERIRVKPYQIIAWVSVTPQTVMELPPHAPRMPAILDTGHTHNFSIQERHLNDWARLDVNSLRKIGNATLEGFRLPLHNANVWIHSNVPGQRDQFSNQPPFRLRLKQGIAITPREVSAPRLPLIGLRAVVRNKLLLVVDSERMIIRLRTPDWRTKLLCWFA